MPDDRKRNNRVTIFIITGLIILIIVFMNRSGPHLAAATSTPIPPTPTASPRPGPTHPATIQSPGAPSISPTASEAANWAISFQYRFPDGYWLLGEHQYTLRMACPLAQNPTDRSQEWTNAFGVSPAAPLISGDVYLRPEGIGSAVLFRQPITAISDTQPTVALVSVTGLTYSQADWYPRNCTVTIQTDHNPVQPIPAGAPYQP